MGELVNKNTCTMKSSTQTQKNKAKGDSQEKLGSQLKRELQIQLQRLTESEANISDEKKDPAGDQPSTRFRNKPGPSSSKPKELEKREDHLHLYGTDTEMDEETVVANSESEYSSDDEVAPPSRKRKRGKPPVTGDHLRASKKKAHEREIRRLRAEQKALREMLNRREGTPERELRIQYSSMTPEMIAAEMLEKLEAVERVARRSKNLKGTFVKGLLQAANALRAAVTILASKGSNSNTGVETTEVRLLREEKNRLEREVAELKKEREERVTRATGMTMGVCEEEGEEMDLTVDEISTPPPPQTAIQTPSYIRKEVHERGRKDGALRPLLQGKRKALEAKTGEAKAGVKRVMEGISITAVTEGEDPTVVRKRLRDVILRCQGAMASLPDTQREDNREESAANQRTSATASSKTALALAASKRERSARREDPVAERNKSKGGKGKPQPQNKTAAQEEEKGKKGQGGQSQPKPPQQKESLDEKAQKRNQEKKQQGAEPPRSTKGTYADAAKKSQARKQVGPGAAASQPTRKNPVEAGKGGGASQLVKAQVGSSKGAQRPQQQQRRRAPKTEAIILTFPPGQYAQGMREVREKLNLETL
ncbi:PREDICTED: uncharacterized protein LOC105561626, partial [Vollenhovia emeryi]|uniref:uncharacterized protein LOC105561626 n=1 Tax=Vollenhovia emeryi TaxID=411798 RepID=UPI0005F557B1